MVDIIFLTLEEVLTLHDDAISFAGGETGKLTPITELDEPLVPCPGAKRGASFRPPSDSAITPAG